MATDETSNGMARPTRTITGKTIAGVFMQWSMIFATRRGNCSQRGSNAELKLTARHC
ncbi:hypothetical protein [Escherichia coli]|uniref:hypothetical protein n=1 Tax=Escherichia coli TaxID=562 RepID=UPI00157B17FC|nr:hypothetical protein [Escherichia coli]